tara:strand:- start:130 stop:300 length:171 start_codon:yes stop_codon:yes gene_type:complete
MKDKITQLRMQLKGLKKSKLVKVKKKNIQRIILPYIKKTKKSYLEEEINNNILFKL